MEKNIRKDEELFVSDLADFLINRLSGEYVKDKIVMTRPSKEFIIGCLSATFSKETYQRTIAKTNSMSVSFLVKSFKELKLKLQGSLFYPISDADLIEDYSQTEWKKRPFTFGDIAIIKPNGTPLHLDFKNEIAEIKEDLVKNKLKKDKIPNFNWGLDISVRVSPYIQDGEKLTLVTVYIVNTTPGEKENRHGELKPVREFDTSLFNISFELMLNTKLVSFKFDYEYEGYKENYFSDVKSLNCGAEYDSDKDLIKTSFAKKFFQPLILPRNELISFDGKEKLSLSFSDLIEPDTSKKLLNKILNYMQEYLEYYVKKSKTEDEKYKNLTSNYERVIKNFKEGILCLDNPKVMKAFNLMQKSFFKKDQSQTISFGGWRLFQLVYILSLLPDIVDVNKNHKEASVLHVDTGGGKSEAYFGLVVFSAFLDRIEGKRFGLTAITKFPLRMLSIQQLQRIATIFAWAEEIRKEEKLDGAFSLGYLVGESSDFPNNNYLIFNQILAAKNKKEIPGKILTNCPICKSEDSVKLDVDEVQKIIIHKCKSCKREFHLYFCDDEIYRKLPTFIISTVDKMAAIGMQRKVKNLFGGQIDECKLGHGYLPHNDKCNYKEAYKTACPSLGKPVNITFNTAPRLIIQDEMHLIREAFGTIDSHFETFLETMAHEFKGQFFKNIAMTATICGASDQIKQLYNKETNIFPSESPEGKGIKDFFFERYSDSQRLILGLTPNMVDNQAASLLTLRLIVEYIREIEKDKAGFADKKGISLLTLNEIIRYYKAYLTYHNKVSDVNGMSYFLEAVANSKLRPSKYSIHKFLLTSALSVDEIKDIINRITAWDTLNSKEIPVSFATNLVSHGVDIVNWNIMIFQGIPRSTAEYIQALSRVGRQHVGLVIDWFYPNRIRDQSYFQNFKEYHEILNHHVERVPLARWAKLGFHQTFNTLFCGAILNYLSNKLGKPIYSLSDYRSTFSNLANLDEIKRFLKEAYSLSQNTPGSKYFYEQIDIQVESRNEYLMNYSGQGKEIYFFPNCLTDSNIPYFKMQTGMRGIQDNIELCADDRENTFVNSYKRDYLEDEGGENAE